MFSMLGGVLESIQEFLMSVMLISPDILLYLFGGLELLFILASAVRLVWCYEDRSMRAMKRINKYLKSNPKVNDDNLIEFHKKMKKLPRRIRDRWQLFMLEREGSPSRYMTVEYCVKRPLYNSAITMNQKQIGYATVILAVLGFILALSNLTANNAAGSVAAILLEALIVPAIVAVMGSIYVMILHLKYTNVNHDFYDMFTAFVRNIDKATNTMPDYVDYELLFTKKEIERGIPVLREYLEKRAMEEQRLLEKAKREDVNHSPYDFSSLGVNGEQLIERAVNESEKFLIEKIQTQNEITELEKQLQKSSANMEEIERDANRKLQAIKENLERLDKAMSETTNRVEINYNRRQADAEMEKKLLLEKDMETMLGKEQVAADALKVEIQKRKETIEENKKAVEDALKSEYDTFATKVYDELNEKITRDNSEQLHEMEMTIARLKAKVKEFTRDIEKKESVIEARNLEIDNMRQQLSKQKGKQKSKKDFGQEYIHAQDNNPEGTINAIQVNYDDAPEQQFAPQETQFAEQQQAESAPLYDMQEPQPQYDNTAPFDENAQMYADYPQQEYDASYMDANAWDANAQYDVNNGQFGEMQDANYNQFDSMQPEYPQDAWGQQQEQPYPEQLPYYDETSTGFTYPEEPQAPVIVGFVPTVDKDDLGASNIAVVADEKYEFNDMPVPYVAPKAPEPAVKIDADFSSVSESPEIVEITEQNPKEAVVKKSKESSLKPAKKVGVKKLTDGEDGEGEEEAAPEAVEEVKEEKTAETETKTEPKEEVTETEEKATREVEKEEKVDDKKYVENDDLVALQKQIEAENARLKQQQEELRAQIDKTLATMEKASNASKAERTRNIKKIKDMIAQLKEQAASVKANGGSKAEINKINKSAAELLKVLADYQSKK